MYRCTECNAEYSECPDFCVCGNDTFEEILDEDLYYDDEVEEEYVKPKPKKPKLTQEEIEEIEADKLDKKKALIAISVSLFICLMILCFAPPHMKKKVEKVKKAAIAQNVKIPDVSTYWDNTVASPYRKKDPNWNLPILNKHFSSISPVLRDYLVTVGAEFNRLWDATLVDGTGECRVEFTINKEGNLGMKKLATPSHNESMDDSVLLLLSKINSFDIPPDDYKGERIIIGFKIDKNKSSKVYFPTN